MTKKSILGLDENVVGLLSYALFFFSGIVVLVMEKENKTVRFHALQSILWFILLSIVSRVVSWLPFVGPLLGSLIGMLTVASWLFLMYSAFTNKQFKIPIIGDVVEAQVNK
jgi:uncharacterized membrane protein